MSTAFLLTSLVIVATPGTGVLYTLSAGTLPGQPSQRHRGVRLHPRHCPAHGCGGHRIGRAAPHERGGLPHPEVPRRRLPALPGLVHLTGQVRPDRRRAGGPRVHPAGDHLRGADQHPQPQADDLLLRIPPAVRPNFRAQRAVAHAWPERGLHAHDLRRLRGIRDLRIVGPAPRHLAAPGRRTDSPDLRAVLRGAQRQADRDIGLSPYGLAGSYSTSTSPTP